MRVFDAGLNAIPRSTLLLVSGMIPRIVSSAVIAWII